MNWLLLRGLARDKRHWGDFGSLFERRVQDSNVFMLDLPGMGTERHRGSPLSISGIADDLRHRWLQLTYDFGSPWSILAVSLGGMVAIDWCDRYPYDFQKLVLVNSSSGGISNPIRRLQPPVWLEFIRIAMAKTEREKESTILGFNSNITSPRSPEIFDEWTRYAEENPNDITNIAKQVVAAARYKAPQELDGIRTLVLASMQDHLTHPSCSWELARRYSAAVAFHDIAGHDLPLDAPEWVADQVNYWLTD